MVRGFIERWPQVGICASFTGLGASAVTLLQTGTIVFSFLGAVFGCAAGFYTWHVQRAKWDREHNHQVLLRAKWHRDHPQDPGL